MPANVVSSGDEEAQDTEYWNVTIAVGAMMVDNRLVAIPNLNNGAAGGCTTGTNNMASWPDSTSDRTGGANGDKATDWDGNSFAVGDKAGFLLYTHDWSGDNAATPTVNYMTAATTLYCYIATSAGTITQYKTDGTQTNP